MINVVQLGSVSYADGLALQNRLIELRKAGAIGDALLLLEHTPVITLGRNAKRENLLAAPEQLAARGVEVYECDRGGDVTFHGPGQLVGYPIFDLRGLKSDGPKDTPTQANTGLEWGTHKTLGAVDYVRCLEEVLIRTCNDFGVLAERIPGLTGVWTRGLLAAAPDPTIAPLARDPDEHNPAKIAAIGVHISRAVTSHGFALNVNTDLDYFKLIVPCGIASKPVTSMSKERGAPVAMGDVAQSVARNLGRVFNSQVLWLESLDALVPKVGVPMKPPPELRKLRSEEESFLA